MAQQPGGAGRAGRDRVGGQIAGAAVVGAVMAAALAYIWYTTLQVDRSSCTDAGVVCLGPDFGGAIADLVVVIGGSLAGFAFLRIRPLLVSVPAAILVAYVVVQGVAVAVPGGGPPAAWAVIPLLAVGFALVAGTVLTAGRPRVAAAALVAVLLIAAMLAPRMINSGLQSSQQRAKLTALPVSLFLPVAAGYKVADAYPVSDTLNIDMVTAGARRDRFGAYDHIAFTVIIGPVTDPYMYEVLAGCPGAAGGQNDTGALQAGPSAPPNRTAAVSAKPEQGCHPLGPEEWNYSGGGTEDVIARRGGTAVSATAGNESGVPLQALTQAVVNLRPASVDEILAIDSAR